MLLRIGSVLLGALFCAQVSANTLDINLSEDVAQFEFTHPIAASSGYGGSEVNFGFLYTTDDDVMGTLGFQIVDTAGSGSPGLDVGVGVKAFSATFGTHEVLAAGIGGEVIYSPSAFPRAVLNIELHYAPDIVSFIDANRLFNYGVRVGYEVVSQAMVYVGYRHVQVEVGNNVDIDIDNSGHIGLQLLF